MRLSRTWVGKAVAGVALVVASDSARAAFATGIHYDLRFTDGSHVRVARAGTYTVDLWGVLTGIDGTSTDDGIFSSCIVIESQQFMGGSITGGGVVAGSVSPDFQAFAGTLPVFRNGGAQDINGDGITDWGSSSTLTTDSNYMLARPPAMATGGGSVGDAVDANTWEFKLASFTINIGASDGAGWSRFGIAKPGWSSVFPLCYATGRIDGLTFNITNMNQQGAYVDSLGVTFVPEPGVMSLIGGAAALMLGRRGRSGGRGKNG